MTTVGADGYKLLARYPINSREKHFFVRKWSSYSDGTPTRVRTIAIHRGTADADRSGNILPGENQ